MNGSSYSITCVSPYLIIIFSLCTPATGSEEITDEDLDNISVFALHVDRSGISRQTFYKLRQFFCHKLNLNTEYLIQRRIDFLSNVKPILIDMCINSCCLFSGEWADCDTCDFCDAHRFHNNGKPITRFSYLPLIPHLQGYFECTDMVQWMNYRHNYTFIDGQVNDVFDSENYRALCEEYVIVKGVRMGFKFFEGQRDIALVLG
ncbi:hypothetical protein BU17DRAFT_50472 [Hysterangium stoloniferum]|nr:hypothetical protein BU17DRAFT_50472 [Hysterangium stoloniferum]